MTSKKTAAAARRAAATKTDDGKVADSVARIPIDDDKPTAAEADAAARSQFNPSLKRGLNNYEKLLASIPDSGSVTIGCKLPHGLQLRVFRQIEQHIPAPGGTQLALVSQEVGRVHVKGFARTPRSAPNYTIIGDFALTPNVDAQFFKEWVRQNRFSKVVENGLIFHHADAHKAADMAEERKDLRSGLEALTPDSDPRMVKLRNKNLEDVTTEEDRKRAMGE